MFDVFMDYVKKLLKSRIFPITLIYLALFCIVIYRLFELQIVKGQEIIEENGVKETESREIDSTRGNIYDCNGKLLASNSLTYSIVMTDSTKIENNEQRNAIIDKLVKIILKNGDTLENEFYITGDTKDNLKFTVEGAALTRFKKKVYEFVVGKGEITDEQLNASAKDLYEFMRTGEGYKNINKMFEISDSYSVEDTLKIMSIRYALFCNWPKYLQITVASNVSNSTIMAIEENSAELPGVEVKQQTHRVYADSIYFANIIGYTGLISAEDLEEKNKITKVYDPTDIIGKDGIEKEQEDILKGTKGSEIVSVNSAGRVKDIIDHIDPIAGNDIYLTINSDLQISTYHLIERELAQILYNKITSDMNYGSKGESAKNILIPIYEVYNALLKNNIIDIHQLDDNDASTLEQQTYDKYNTALTDVFNKYDSLLDINNTTVNNQAGDMEDFLDYFYTVLKRNKIILSEKIPSEDATLADYKNNKISLSKFIQYALANNWVDRTKLGIGDEFYIAEELYQKLITYTKNIILKTDDEFQKMIYRNLIFSYKLTGNEICLLLFDQGVLKYSKTDIDGLKAGSISPYSFIMEKIKKIEITPAMLALEPCSGSVVITDVNNGDIRAMVTYPGYDNNKFAGKIDSEYYNKIHSDLSLPWMNRPTTQRTAPGSTFKMVTSVAALEEGIISPSDTIYDMGEFTRIGLPYPKCDIYPGSHGAVDIRNALKVSCNYFFFEMGWKLSIENGKYISELGLKRLKKYATMLGLNKKSGVELNEAPPEISNTDAVRSSIGQGSNVYAPVQLARYVTTIANRGTSYELTLLDKIVGNDGSLVEDNSAKIDQKLTKVSSTTWDAVWEGMYSVVNKMNGSANGVFGNFGITVAGKTGTSQVSKKIPNNALFVSFAPYKNPEISVTAVIPNGYTSHNAAELAKNIYSLYFKLVDEKTLLNSEFTTDKNSSNAID